MKRLSRVLSIDIRARSRRIKSETVCVFYRKHFSDNMSNAYLPQYPAVRAVVSIVAQYEYASVAYYALGHTCVHISVDIRLVNPFPVDLKRILSVV